MPLKVLTSPLTLVTSFFSRKPKSSPSDSQSSPTSRSGRPSSTTSSVTFTNTVSIAGFSHGKSSSSMSSPCDSQFNESKEMLQYWHNRPLVFTDTPEYSLEDFELLDTVGNVPTNIFMLHVFDALIHMVLIFVCHWGILFI